ncbi:MAG: hypothetical protein E7324_08340 [Clostridiales bacterium]|nr:hypothetical protein [Clostridiales bacterium]
MKYKKRSVIVGLMLIIGAVISAACFTGKRDVDWLAICKEKLDKNQDALLLLMAEYQGQFVDMESEAFGSFASFFDGGLTCADLRDPTKAFFSFSVLHPETSKRLLYCPDNRPQIMADLFLEAEEVRLENLGVNQKGYIWCIRLKDGWFYWESYLPT